MVSRLKSTLNGLAGLMAIAVLGGCASVYRVDNQVETFARWSQAGTPSTGAATPAAPIPAPPQRFQFDRLPSQANNADRGQAELENMVAQALAPLGWTVAEPASGARWRIEIQANTQRLPRAPWEDPYDNRGWFWGSQLNIGVGLGHGQLMWSPWMMRAEMPYYQRAVGLVIRDGTNGQVVYETRAAHDGRWNSTPALWAAMFRAALQGFPVPPEGVREVNIDLPR